jgi:hypothetical protein
MPGLSGSFFSGIGGALSDLYSADAMRAKGKGSRIEAEQYMQAAAFAQQNALFTQQSTAIKQYQTSRGIVRTLGSQAAEVAASGFAASGSALDLERDSAIQGAITKAALAQQGKIEEAGYEQQAASYRLMASAASEAATAADHAAVGMQYSAIIKGAGAAFSLL